MVLSFSTHLNGKPTHFVEKIWEGIIISNDNIRYFRTCDSMGLLRFPSPFHPKIHTIRADPHVRWKEGRNIQMVVFNRTPKRYQFAPDMLCTGTQQISICHTGSGCMVFVDEKPLTVDQIKELAINDGFESPEAFFEYFAEDFDGVIIHWTNHRYQ